MKADTKVAISKFKDKVNLEGEKLKLQNQAESQNRLQDEPIGKEMDDEVEVTSLEEESE